MRLEIDTTVSAPPLTDRFETESGVDSAEVKSVLNQGIKSAQAGNRAQARMSLTRATELDPRNESAWLWLASISEYPEELLGFLNHVLDINPVNERALEWKAATHSLLSKTFVQRGVDASQENNHDLANECFRTALEYDERNADAWMWMASVSTSSTVKITMLEKALDINPENEFAEAALEAARAGILKERLNEAKAAAVTGDLVTANNVLDALLAVNPHSVDAWMMKSHLTDSFDEKIRCFESILLIDPNNIAAMAGRDSLLSIFGTVEAAHADSSRDVVVEGGSPYVEPAHEPVSEISKQDFHAPQETVHEFVSPQVATEHYPEDSVEPVDEPEQQDFHAPQEIVHEFVPPQVESDYPEDYDDHEILETVAEPFATLAEETTEPVEAAVDADHSYFYGGVSDAEQADTAFTLNDDYAPLDATVFSYDPEPHIEQPMSAAFEAEEFGSYDEPSGMTSSPAIEMPRELLPETVKAPVVTFVDGPEVISVRPESFDCPFCHHTNDAQTMACSACRSVLSLSDLEMLLANQNSDMSVLRNAVEDMERNRASREFTPDDLITLGLGHINLRNLQTGYTYLHEASKQCPNNVVLSGQVNALLIRLDEIKKQEEAHLKMPKGKSILVVDDSPTIRKLISGKLEKSGHEVICANDGVEAMECLEKFVPDLVLLDITMPRMDGYQVCKQIRSNAATKDVTVVMISGKDGFFDKVRGRMAGTTGYITKPFGPETLMKTVEMYLSGEAPDLDEA